jgi:hypothetical protein
VGEAVLPTGVAIVVPETPEPRDLQAGPGERRRRIRDANRRDVFFYTGDLPSGRLRLNALCSSLYDQWGPDCSFPSDEGGKDRYVIVDVGGQTVIINVTAPSGKFDAFSPKAQKMLDTIEWKSE